MNFAVVSWRVRAGALVAADESFDPSLERGRAVTGPVVGDQWCEVGDAVGGEVGLCLVEEPDHGCSFLVLERFGVGQTGESVDDRVEVGVANFLFVSSFGSQCLLAASAMGPPAASVGDLPDFFDIHMGYVPGIAGTDLPWTVSVLPLWGDVPKTVEPEPVQPASYGALVAVDVVLVKQFMGDAGC